MIGDYIGDDPQGNTVASHKYALIIAIVGMAMKKSLDVIIYIYIFSLTPDNNLLSRIMGDECFCQRNSRSCEGNCG